jgi:hypothetical protein
VFSEPEFIVAFLTDSGLRLGFVKLDGVMEELLCMDDNQPLAVVDSLLFLCVYMCKCGTNRESRAFISF